MSLKKMGLGDTYEVWNGGRRSPRQQASGFDKAEAIRWAKLDRPKGRKILVVKVSRTLVRV